MEQNTLTKNLIAWSAVATILAGLIHLWIVPEHMAHAPAHGILFLLIGIAQIIWGIAVWRRPSVKLYYAGVLMAGWLIVLYAITRWLPAPFGHGPESIQTIDLVCKFCEGLAMVSLAVLIFQGLILKAGQFVAWRTITLIVLFSFISGFVTYGAPPNRSSLRCPRGLRNITMKARPRRKKNITTKKERQRPNTITNVHGCQSPWSVQLGKLPDVRKQAAWQSLRGVIAIA